MENEAVIKKGFLISKNTYDINEFVVTKESNGRVYFLDHKNKEGWNKIETEMHLWVLDGWEVAKQKLKEMIESKIQSSEYKIQFLKERLISYNLID